jgi:hypothetical protein
VIERACLHLDAETLRHKLRNCPPGMAGKRVAYRSPGPAAAAQRRPTEPDEREGGWLVGVVAPGESSPVYSPDDRQTLSEVFAPSAWGAVMEQVRKGSNPIGLWVRHNGLMLSCTSARTLRLEVHPVLGLMFEATLSASSLERMLIDDCGRSGIGCSVAFHSPVLGYDQRGGRKVRVVKSCVMDHVALVRKGSGERAAYAASRCFGVTADKRDQLPKAWSDARTAAWAAMKRQSGLA